ncbi:MAG: rod shape-determining protein RodA [Sphingobacteriales bacterium]|nr:rod shape-determining protein RodA [Sphingobacteriales bacterium]
MNENRQGISKGIDTTVMWLYFALVAIGWVAIFSVEYRSGDNALQKIMSFNTNYAKQLFFIGLSIVIGIFVLLTDSKFFTTTANLAYAFGIVALLLVFPFHSHIKGTNSIIKIGVFNFQPAEICKLFVALALAKYLSRLETNFNKTNSHLIAFALTLTPSILAIFQNETGLALVYFSFFIVMYREGLPAWYLVLGFSLIILVVATLLVDKYVLAIILTAVAVFIIYLLYTRFRRYRSFTLMVMLIWGAAVAIQLFAVPYIFESGKILKGYQVKRIYAAIGKDYVPKNAEQLKEIQEKEKGKKKDEGDYNVKQSKIAIGSGGVLGKGFLKGLQTQGDFVPEQHTDFIFTAWAESFGFWGSVLLLGLYLFLILRIVNIAERQRSAFSRVYAYSVASIIFFHVMVNICMTVGLAPVIGIPLPLLSYGGASLLTFTVLIFVLLRLDADRQMVLR